MRIVTLVAASPDAPSPRLVDLLLSSDRIIAVDGGLAHLHKQAIQPDLIIGDMDSVDPTLLDHYSHIPCKQFPCDKDFTDLELAIQEALADKPDKIQIIAATGGRIDHTLAATAQLVRHPGLIHLLTNEGDLFAITKETTLSLPTGQTLSLFAAGSATGVTTSGLKWNLDDATLNAYFFSQSNVVEAATVTIALTSGALFCFLLRGDQAQMPQASRLVS